MHYKILTNTYLRTIQKYFWGVLVLFCMSSCAVKESLFSQLGLETAKPLNRTKTTSTCQYTTIATSTVVQVEVQTKKTFLTVVNLLNIPPFLAVYCSTDFNTIKNNSPPYYILYQQLKIALMA